MKKRCFVDEAKWSEQINRKMRWKDEKLVNK